MAQAHIGKGKYLGFSYIEVVFVLAVISLGLLGLVQMSLQQTTTAKSLNNQLQAQLLLLNIQSRLSVNKDYINQQQNQAYYFTANTHAQCKESKIDCYSSACNSHLLAQADMSELTCLASDHNLALTLELLQVLNKGKGATVLTSIYSRSNACPNKLCLISEDKVSI